MICYCYVMLVHFPIIPPEKGGSLEGAIPFGAKKSLDIWRNHAKFGGSLGLFVLREWGNVMTVKF